MQHFIIDFNLPPSPDELRALSSSSYAPATTKLIDHVKCKQEVNEHITTARARDNHFIYQSISHDQHPRHSFGL
ncbi:hypothetical protein PAXRUDRAFT_16412 [Paxillus rubicundulus Ve08.2h10]|uniref:Uncharacterized protein n=1 Tax=Paxillus rubicundulus Ve08.2h10 TaxID=930991 RepID=A0A0D0D6H8_9AGAM|nr:hypothetical protein PAXRUDRAFT_16412 [Paxillus rubicundulus Ve08.2h10]